MFLSYSLHVSIVGICTLRQKTESWWQRAIETTLATGANTPLSHCHAWLGYTILSAACQSTHTWCTLNWTAGGRHAGRAAGKERGRMGVGGRELGEGGERGSKGRECGIDYTREGGSGRGGRVEEGNE